MPKFVNWNSELEFRIGIRNWISELDFGIGIRIWNSDLEFRIGIRDWNSELVFLSFSSSSTPSAFQTLRGISHA